MMTLSQVRGHRIFEVGIKKSDIGAKEENLLEFLLFGITMITDAKGE